MAQKGSYQQGTRKLGKKPEPKKSGPGRVSRARYQKTRKTRVGFRVFSGFCTLYLLGKLGGNGKQCASQRFPLAQRPIPSRTFDFDFVDFGFG